MNEYKVERQKSALAIPNAEYLMLIILKAETFVRVNIVGVKGQSEKRNMKVEPKAFLLIAKSYVSSHDSANFLPFTKTCFSYIACMFIRFTGDRDKRSW